MARSWPKGTEQKQRRWELCPKRKGKIPQNVHAYTHKHKHVHNCTYEFLRTCVTLLLQSEVVCVGVRVCVCVRSQVEEPFVRLECTCMHTPSLDHSISVWKHLRLARPERTREWFVCCAVIKYPCEEGLPWPATSDCCSSYCWRLPTRASKVPPWVDRLITLCGIIWRVAPEMMTTLLRSWHVHVLPPFQTYWAFLLSGFVECTQFLVL